MSKIKNAVINSGKVLLNNLPILLGVIILVSLTKVLIPSSFYNLLFQNNFLDYLTSGVIGSISAGNPINSYVLGGEFLSQGVALGVVTTFIVTWVTVGIIQLPAESALLNKKFAIYRNLLSFFSAIIIGLIIMVIPWL
jgi:uncharacterized membrane protein YraQ (UPF0718 family)